MFEFHDDRRTGIPMPTNVKKRPDGRDDIDDFFEKALNPVFAANNKNKEVVEDSSPESSPIGKFTLKGMMDIPFDYELPDTAEEEVSGSEPEEDFEEETLVQRNTKIRSDKNIFANRRQTTSGIVITNHQKVSTPRRNSLGSQINHITPAAESLLLNDSAVEISSSEVAEDTESLPTPKSNRKSVTNRAASASKSSRNSEPENIAEDLSLDLARIPTPRRKSTSSKADVQTTDETRTPKSNKRPLVQRTPLAQRSDSPKTPSVNLRSPRTKKAETQTSAKKTPTTPKESGTPSKSKPVPAVVNTSKSTTNTPTAARSAASTSNVDYEMDNQDLGQMADLPEENMGDVSPIRTPKPKPSRKSKVSFESPELPNDPEVSEQSSGGKRKRAEANDDELERMFDNEDVVDYSGDLDNNEAPPDEPAVEPPQDEEEMNNSPQDEAEENGFEEEIAEEAEAPVRAPKAKGKGKAKGKAPKKEPTAKRTTKSKAAAKKDSNPKSTFKKIDLDDDDNDDEYDEEGVRRSRRHKVKPVAFWAGEKVVYKQIKDEKSHIKVPVIDNILKLDEESIKTEKRTYTKRLKSHSVQTPSVKQSTKRVKYDEPEDIMAFNAHHGTEELQTLIVTPELFAPRAVNGRDYLFERVFTEGDHVNAGIFVIPEDQEIPGRATGSYTILLTVITGSVRVFVNKSNYLVGPGTLVFIPRMNLFRVKNESEGDAEIYWVTATEVKQASPLMIPPKRYKANSKDLMIELSGDVNGEAEGGPSN
ncbi:hypothetical protein HK098_006279 [Nowakowskiella sp. JEL0407]|nr:hypothetical protein HK098_006279 [Nowakowskiella sp. JEL0407]